MLFRCCVCTIRCRLVVLAYVYGYNLHVFSFFCCRRTQRDAYPSWKKPLVHPCVVYSPMCTCISCVWSFCILPVETCSSPESHVVLERVASCVAAALWLVHGRSEHDPVQLSIVFIAGLEPRVVEGGWREEGSKGVILDSDFTTVKNNVFKCTQLLLFWREIHVWTWVRP